MDPMHTARLHLQWRDPFLAAGALYLDLEERSLEWWRSNIPWNAPTAATDGRKVYYYKPFLDAIIKENTQVGVDFLLAHETLHVLGCDHARRENRDPLLWNIAGDYRIHDVMEEGGWQIPKSLGGTPPLHDKRFHGMSIEQIYAILRQEQDKFDSSGGKKGKDHKKGHRSIGVVLSPCDKDGNPLSAEALEAEAQNWQAKAQQAAEVAKSCGKLRGCWERLVGEVLEPKIPWQEVLRRFIRDAKNRRGEDFTWTPANRRALHRGLYFPAIEKVGMNGLDIHWDLSGSIGQREVDAVCPEIARSRQDSKPDLTRIIYFDDGVARVDHLEIDQPVDITGVKAGGGTDFKPSFEWVEKSGRRPDCAIVFTDLCCSSYPEEPPYPVLWVTTVAGSKAPWGVTLELEVEG